MLVYVGGEISQLYVRCIHSWVLDMNGHFKCREIHPAHQNCSQITIMSPSTYPGPRPAILAALLLLILT